jgi:hypothetical protein
MADKTTIMTITKRVIAAILLVELAVAATLAGNAYFGTRTHRTWEQQNTLEESVSGVSPAVSAFMAGKMDDLRNTLSAKYGEGNWGPDHYTIVRDDRNLFVMKFDAIVTDRSGTYEIPGYGVPVPDVIVTGRESYELWFDFADTVDGMPSYTLMSDGDPIYRYYSWTQKQE